MHPDIDLSHAVWRTSTRSNNGGACVEVAMNLPGVVAIRDSKDPAGPVLTATRVEWEGFVTSIKGASGDCG